MQSVNLTKYYKEYKGKWLAFADDFEKLIGVGTNAKKVYTDAVKNGYKVPILFKMPLQLKPFFG